MNPPPTTLTPLDDDVARSDALGQNCVMSAGDAAMTEGRNRVYVSGASIRAKLVVAPAPKGPDRLDVDEPLDYDAGVAALRRARLLDDEVDIPHRSPFSE